MRCEKCGKENTEGSKFCTGCGTPMIKAAPTNSSLNENRNYNSKETISYAQSPSGAQKEEPKIYIQKSVPDSHTPISMWGYLGYEILFSIPSKEIMKLR